MTIRDDLKKHVEDVIDEYLLTATTCLQKGSEAAGYSAVVLLFSALEAIISYSRQEHSKDDLFVIALTHNPFNLTASQSGNVKDWFRNPLAHNGCVARNAILDLAHTECRPFEFSHNNAVTKIYVDALLEVTQG